MSENTATLNGNPGAISEAHSEPAWLAEWRNNAWTAFTTQEDPSQVDHLWRYTKPAPFGAVENPFLVGDQPTVSTWEDLVAPMIERGELAGAALVYNGWLVNSWVDESAAGQGVIVTDLHTAAKEHEELFKAHFGTAVGQDFGKFEGLNWATWQSGIFVHVPANVTLENPIHIFAGGGDFTWEAGRTLVVTGTGSKATVIEELGSGSKQTGNGHANLVSELVAGDNSDLRYVAVQRYGVSIRNHWTARASLGKDSRFQGIITAFGGAISKANVGSILRSAGGNSEWLGVVFGAGTQHFDHRTVHDHRASHTYSNFDFKVVLRDTARSAYTGLIRIEKDAQVCEAYQENRNLLLNPGTQAESIPELEIMNEEVKCSHGATVGPINENEVFYLQCRGIERKRAIQMLVAGFIETTFERVPADLHDRLREIVEQRLETI